jgi:poly(A) polymerase/tRNA nucleotidyltransferase (CCA-adding enzyme)
MLKINGHDIMKILKIKPSPRIGLLLRALLNEVLDNPAKNKKEALEKRLLELNKLSEGELEEKAKEVELKKEEIELAEKRKFGV